MLQSSFSLHLFLWQASTSGEQYLTYPQSSMKFFCLYIIVNNRKAGIYVTTRDGHLPSKVLKTAGFNHLGHVQARDESSLDFSLLVIKSNKSTTTGKGSHVFSIRDSAIGSGSLLSANAIKHTSLLFHKFFLVCFILVKCTY